MNKPPSSSSSGGNTDWEHAYTIPVKIEKSGNSSATKNNVEQSEVDAKFNANESGLDRHGLRNTVDIGEQVLKNTKQENETQKRAFSAPPSNGNCFPKEQDDKHPKQRFTSKIEITPINPYDPPSSGSGNGGNTDGIGGSKNSPNSGDKKSNVRHIPIFVEGRKDPVYPKSTAAATAGVPNESNDQAPLKRKLDSMPPTKSQTDAGSEPPKPVVPKKPNPLHQIADIQKEVDVFAAKIDKFAGKSRSDKEYLYLDEMLTRNLIKLDVIEIDGNEDIRAARKTAIKSIQKCISVLESKVPIANAENTVPPNDVEMESDSNEPQQSTGEVPMETVEDNSTSEFNKPPDSNVVQVNMEAASGNNQQDPTDSQPLVVGNHANPNSDNNVVNNDVAVSQRSNEQ